MKTISCRRLYDYWNERRGSRAAPERGDLEPGAIRKLLADSFLVSLDAAAGHPLRLAGTRLCALFGREIKGEALTSLFTTERPDIADLIAAVGEEATPAVAGVMAAPPDLPPAALELLLLPLYLQGRRDRRLLGMLAPVAIPYWLGTATVDRLVLGTTRHLRAGAAPTLAGSNPPRGLRPGWTVYEGGRL